MTNAPVKTSDLVALDSKNNVIKIPNKVLRKPADPEFQLTMPNNSICITCNYIFRDKHMTWTDKIKSICHPFKDDFMFPKTVLKYLFSESDFCDKIISPFDIRKKREGYDFVYFTINSVQGIECKGLYLLQMIDEAAGLAGLKGLVIDYGPPIVKMKVRDKQTPEYVLKKIRKFSPKNLIIKKKLMDSQEVCDTMKSAKFVLFPNTKDASPRLLTEALIRNCPVVVNSNIYGGWKYVNENTGMFFDAPNYTHILNNKTLEEQHVIGLYEVFQKIMEANLTKVSDNYYESFGFVNTAKRLAEIINFISDTDYKMVCYKEYQHILRQV